MDAVGGLAISWLVIRAGWANTKTSLVELADAGIDDEVKDKVRNVATKAIEAMSMQDITVRKVQGIKAGQSYLLEIEIAVPQDWSVGKTSAVEDAIRTRVGERVRGARRVRVRFVPAESGDDFVEEFISPSVSARSSPEPEDQHDHEHANGHSHQDHAQGPNGSTDGLTKRK
jgi:divalent metal cation (Fe/Co/Zn/Cd) transporter